MSRFEDTDLPAFATPDAVMGRALELAGRGVGFVEPNPPVGAVIVDDGLRLLGEGWHERFGGAHAEVNAIRAAGERSRGATLYVTLEPCGHHGKTPPCVDAILAAGLRRVVVAVRDPAPHTAGGGINRLREAGIVVEEGLRGAEAERLIRPFTTLMTRGRPYVHAKWAMTLDGRIATRTGDSKWITGEAARAWVHRLRGRMDAIITGIGTVLADDALLTARPAGPRTPVRIVLDSHARLPLDSQLVRTIDQAPLLVATLETAEERSRRRLVAAGAEVLALPAAGGTADGTSGRVPLDALLAELGRRTMTNVLLEAGGAVLGAFFDARLVDECHVFVGSRIVGDAGAPGPVAGRGCTSIADALRLGEVRWESFGEDGCIHGVPAWPL